MPDPSPMQRQRSFVAVVAIAALLCARPASDVRAQGPGYPVDDVGPSYQVVIMGAAKDILSATDYQALRGAFRTFLDEAWRWVGMGDVNMDGVPDLIRVLPPDDPLLCWPACNPDVWHRTAAGWDVLSFAQPDYYQVILPGEYVALRDEVVNGKRTLFHTPLGPQTNGRPAAFPKAHRQPDERVAFDPVSLTALVDLDGDGVANWRFALTRLERPRLQVDYTLDLFRFEAGVWLEMEPEIPGVQSDTRDGRPALYLRDEFAGPDGDVRRTYYTSPNGPRLRVPFN